MNSNTDDDTLSNDNNPLNSNTDDDTLSNDNNHLISNTDDDTLSGDNNPLISNTDNVSLTFKDRIGGRLKTILCHCILVIIAIICLIVSGILSILHPPDNIINGNYSDCTSDHDNITLEYF